MPDAFYRTRSRLRPIGRRIAVQDHPAHNASPRLPSMAVNLLCRVESTRNQHSLRPTQRSKNLRIDHSRSAVDDALSSVVNRCCPTSGLSDSSEH